MERPIPTRFDCEAIVLALIEGTMSREDAHDWAAVFVTGSYDHVRWDPAVWLAIMNIVGADAITTDRPYLYAEADFRAWLAELQNDE